MKFPIAAVSAALALAPTSAAGEGSADRPLPLRIVDCHHHFLDLANNTFSSWLGNLVGPLIYLPEAYKSDVVDPLSAEGVELAGTVHLEILPDTPLGGVDETRWINELVQSGRAPHVEAIVASCDLGDDANAAECLRQMNVTSNLVRGIRWILAYVGPFNGTTATHVNALRKDVDYLRGGEDGGAVPSFEAGYGMLADYGWSFDAQVAPAQLEALADLADRHPDVPVIVNHLGKPRLSAPPAAAPDTTAGGTPDEEEWTPTPEDEAELGVWRDGMRLLADLPHTYVKLSMLGYVVPDWTTSSNRTDLVKSLVLETVELFGPRRCMFGLNWFLGASFSDNNGRGTVGPDPVALTTMASDWLKEYSEEDRDWIFAKTAETAYRFANAQTETITTVAATVLAATTTTTTAMKETSASEEDSSLDEGEDTKPEEADDTGTDDAKVKGDSSGSRVSGGTSAATFMVSAGVAVAWMAI